MRIAITVDPYCPRAADALRRDRARRRHGRAGSRRAGPRRDAVRASRQPHGEASSLPYGAPPHFGWWPRAVELRQVGVGLWRRRRETRRGPQLRPARGAPARAASARAAEDPELLPGQRALEECGDRRASGRGFDRLHRVLGQRLPREAADGSRRGPVADRPRRGRHAQVRVRLTVASDAPLVFLGRLERIKGAHTPSPSRRPRDDA